MRILIEIVAAWFAFNIAVAVLLYVKPFPARKVPLRSNVIHLASWRGSVSNSQATAEGDAA